MSDLGNQLAAMASEFNERRIVCDRAAYCVDIIDRASAEWMKCESVPWNGDLADAVAAGVAEIARLRLSDEECRAIGYAASVLDDPRYSGDAAMAETMRGLLKRHGYDVT